MSSFDFIQVKNFTDVHPDYGARIQALLDKYNSEKPKVSPEWYRWQRSPCWIRYGLVSTGILPSVQQS